MASKDDIDQHAWLPVNLAVTDDFQFGTMMIVRKTLEKNPRKCLKAFFLHEVHSTGQGTATEQVIENLCAHQDRLKRQMERVA